jgi:hypothetical protein
MAETFDPLDDELAEAYVRHMDAAYQAGRSDGRAGGFAEGLAVGILLVLAVVLLWL